MKKLTFLLLFFGIFLLSACDDDNASTAIVVRLTDSPGDYEAVTIDLTSVEVHVDAGTQESGWTTLDSNSGLYNLSDLTNGAEVVIADGTYPAGNISQLRLVLGENSSVVVDGATFPLTVPSGSESGLKVLINAELIEGITYSVLIDFDAAKSVVATGAAEKYLLKPVLKAITEAQDGAIKGTVIPAELGVAVYALSGTDTSSTSFAIEGNSDFFLGGLADGTYTISFDPGELSGFQDTLLENISVSIGAITEMGVTELSQ